MFVLGLFGQLLWETGWFTVQHLRGVTIGWCLGAIDHRTAFFIGDVV